VFESLVLALLRDRLPAADLLGAVLLFSAVTPAVEAAAVSDLLPRLRAVSEA